jgi:hypothetical protein
VIALPAGTYAYVATLDGKESAKTSITIVRNADGTTTISEDGGGSFGGVTGTAKATLALAADGATPASYASHVLVGENVVDSSSTFRGDRATLDGLAGSQTFSLTSGQHFVVLDGGLLSGFIALPSQLAAWPAAPLQLLEPIYGQAAPLLTDSAAKPVRPAGVPAGDVALSVTGPVPLVEWYDPATMLLDQLIVPGKQTLVVTRKP